ncbi:hypothetical protein [Paraburkholderia sp. BL6669N2]|uniref:hypothetical protein n=1 Tax=Paraburkholderia sp. BL6669N2 TaxID=1938807 RepID=UPI0011C07C70|nr:hypothetical protein [Paraburkholderia sp. BL6669N2]
MADQQRPRMNREERATVPDVVEASLVPIGCAVSERAAEREGGVDRVNIHGYVSYRVAQINWPVRSAGAFSLDEIRSTTRWPPRASGRVTEQSGGDPRLDRVAQEIGEREKLVATLLLST